MKCEINKYDKNSKYHRKVVQLIIKLLIYSCIVCIVSVIINYISEKAQKKILRHLNPYYKNT